MEWRDQRGQALVELALVISLLMLIVLGIVEFARVGHAYLVTAHASREGARVGALRYSDVQVADAVWNAAGTLDSQRLTVTITPSEAARYRGQQVEVLVSYSVPLITPFSGVLPDPFPVTGRTVMRVE